MACNPRRALWVNSPLRPRVVDSPEIRSGLTKHAGSLLGIDLGENLRGIIGLDASRAVVWRRRIKSASKSERRSLRTGRLAEWERHPAEAIRIAGLDNGPLPLDIASIPISRNDVDLVDGCSPFADRIFAFPLSAADRRDARIFNLGRKPAARPDTPLADRGGPCVFEGIPRKEKRLGPRQATPQASPPGSGAGLRSDVTGARAPRSRKGHKCSPAYLESDISLARIDGIGASPSRETISPT